MARKKESGKMTAKDVINEKSERIMQGIAVWASFYRSNPHRFVKDYLNVELKLFQKILLYQMMHNNYFMYLASRGQGKSYLTALFCVVRCILFPKTKICIASSTRVQANEVLLKIKDDYMINYDWGSDNLRREIKEAKVGQNDAIIRFHNGSWIQVVTASDSGRGKRANILLVDEFRMVDLDTIDTVLRNFLTTPRQPRYLNNPKYSHLKEPNKEFYMSSAWYASHWSYTKAKTYMENMLAGNKFFVCGLPYQVSIKEDLLMKEQIQDKMCESDFDEMKFAMEMECKWWGDTKGAFFPYDSIANRRKLKEAVYPLSLIGNSRTFKIPDLVPNERRILSVDIALMASKKHKNDASAIIINRAMPTNNHNYVANIVYLENYEGKNTDELAMIVRKLFDEYKCTDLVIDTGGSGLGVFDALIRDMVDPETGELYRALSCCNDKTMAERCKVANAPQVIWSIKGNASFNNDICLSLRNGFNKGKINLLVEDTEADNVLQDKLKSFSKMPVYEQVQYKMPYIQTSLLVNELVKLEHEIKNGNVKIKERAGMRKDRYSSLAYNYYVQCQLERDVLQEKQYGFTMSDFAKRMGGINKKPIMY